MKRLTALWISLLVLLIAVQPVFAFHFCSGKLASVEMSSQTTSGGCSNPSPDDTKEHIGSSCCHTSVVELSTDDYVQQDTNPQIVPFSVWAFIYVKSIFTDVALDSVSLSKRKVPPVSVYKEGRDVLTRFCVYII